MKDFRDLQVWQKAHSLTLDSYKITVEFPRQETYGLVSQIRVVQHPLRPILRKDVASAAMESFSVS